MQWCIVSGGEGCDVVVSGVVSDALTGRCRMGACRQVVGVSSQCGDGTVVVRNRRQLWGPG